MGNIKNIIVLISIFLFGCAGNTKRPVYTEIFNSQGTWVDWFISSDSMNRAFADSSVATNRQHTFNQRGVVLEKNFTYFIKKDTKISCVKFVLGFYEKDAYRHDYFRVHSYLKSKFGEPLKTIGIETAEGIGEKITKYSRIYFGDDWFNYSFHISLSLEKIEFYPGKKMLVVTCRPISALTKYEITSFMKRRQ